MDQLNSDQVYLLTGQIREKNRISVKDIFLITLNQWLYRLEQYMILLKELTII